MNVARKRGRARPQPYRPLVVAAVVLLAVAGAVALRSGDDDHLARAQALLDDDAAFRGASTAGEALLQVSVELQRAAVACDGDGGTVTCDRLFTAAAFARVSSVDVLHCRRPDVFTFRDRFRGYVSALARGEAPVPPSPPNCD